MHLPGREVCRAERIDKLYARFRRRSGVRLKVRTWNRDLADRSNTVDGGCNWNGPSLEDLGLLVSRYS